MLNSGGRIACASLGLCLSSLGKTDASIILPSLLRQLEPSVRPSAHYNQKAETLWGLCLSLVAGEGLEPSTFGL